MRFAAFAIAALFVCAPASAADARGDAAAEMLACASVRGDKARLDCFEKALPGLREAFPEAAEIAERRAEEARLAAREQARQEFGLPAAPDDALFEEKEFGAEHLPQEAKADDDDDDDVDSIEAGVADIGRSYNGKIIVFLDNGQVWRQIDADKSTPYIRSNIEGMTARVKRGFLGSYFIRLSGTHEAFKSRRVK